MSTTSDPRPAGRVERGDDRRGEGVEVVDREVRLAGCRRRPAVATAEDRARAAPGSRRAGSCPRRRAGTGGRSRCPNTKSRPVRTPSWRPYTCSQAGQAAPESGWRSVGWRTATGRLNEWPLRARGRHAAIARPAVGVAPARSARSRRARRRLPGAPDSSAGRRSGRPSCVPWPERAAARVPPRLARRYSHRDTTGGRAIRLSPVRPRH